MTRFVPGAEALVVLMVLFGLHSGWLSGSIGGGFHPGHVWAVDQVAAMLTGSESWSGWTHRIGSPEPVHLRLIGWAPLLVAAPLSFLVGAGPAMWVAIAAGFVLTVRMTAILLERVTGASGAVASASAMVYAFSPFALGVLANGQLAKMQLWCLPWVLLASDRWLKDERSVRRAIEVLVAAAVMGFTAPSIGLVAPIALGAWVVLRADWSLRYMGSAAVVLAIVALGLAIPWAVHTVEVVGTAGLVPAAPVPGLKHPAALSPVASFQSLALATGPWDGSRAAINNVAGLGLPALIASAVAVCFIGRRGLLGVGLIGVGVAFALGPSVVAGGYKWVLPAQLMEWSGYPIVQSGMYYRFAQVATLGMAMMVCGLASALPRRATMIAVAIVGLNLAENVRETSSLWPRSLRSIPNAELMQSMAEDPVDGAVLELPLDHLDTEGERRLLGQLVHGRSTTVLARNMVVIGQPRLERLSALATQPAALSAAGFRYVLLHDPNRNRKVFQQLESAHGPSQGTRQLGLWVVPSAQEVR